MQAFTSGKFTPTNGGFPPLPLPHPSPSQGWRSEMLFFSALKPETCFYRSSCQPSAVHCRDQWLWLMTIDECGWEVKKCLGINKHAHRCQSSRERCLSLSGGQEFNFVSMCFHKVCMKIKMFLGGGVVLKVWVSYDFTQISNSTQLRGQGLALARQMHIWGIFPAFFKQFLR